MQLHRTRKTIGMALSLGIGLLATAGTHATAEQIYRHVDEQGNVTYTDEPPEKDSKPINLKPLPEVSLPKSGSTSNRNAEPDDATTNEPATAYESVTITNPEHDTALWRGGGQVTVQFQSQPGLRRGHRYQLEFDGNKKQTTTSTSISLDNVFRGTHELVVHIIDGSGNVVASSDRTRFTIHRPSQLN